MSQTLTKQEIQTIYRFVKSRGVAALDVQHEIVDHVASDVEAMRKSQPNLTVEDGMRKVHQKFGVKGFSTLSDAFHKRLQKQVFQRFLAHLKSLFTTQKALFTLLFAALAWLATHLQHPEMRFWASLILISLPMPVIIGYFISQIGKVKFKLKKYATYTLPSSMFFMLFHLLTYNAYTPAFGVIFEKDGWSLVAAYPWIVSIWIFINLICTAAFIMLIEEARAKAIKLHELYGVEAA